jgi:hypothetical protein
MSPRATLNEPVIISQFWKNRRHDAVVTTLSTFEGRNLVDIRTHVMDRKGCLVPTPKGVSIVILRLPEPAAAVNKALAKAVELGLLDDESEAGE